MYIYIYMYYMFSFNEIYVRIYTGLNGVGGGRDVNGVCPSPWSDKDEKRKYKLAARLSVMAAIF